MYVYCHGLLSMYNNGSIDKKKNKQASLTGHPMALEQNRSYQSRFGPVRPLFGPHITSALLDVRIVPSCNPVQYQGKLMMQI